jgi:hypothetical protein
MLYVKASRISSNVSKGEVMTLATTDATRVKRLSEHAHKIWSAPVCVLLSLALVLRLLGPSALAGVAVALIVLLINWRASRTFSSVNDNIMKHQQTRMQRFAELIEVCLSTSCLFTLPTVSHDTVVRHILILLVMGCL